MGFDQELEDFKSRIDLREYAAGKGYTLDRKESWRGSAVMRGGGDKVVIKRGPDGHYVYFSVRDDRDNGSIIDFIQNRNSVTLGTVRQELRPWLGRPASPLPLFPKMEKTSKDRMQVEQAYRAMPVPARHAYLEGPRRLTPALLASARFAGRIRTDKFNNAVFPHFDLEGLSGYELKNREFTGFATGGEKGLWFSHTTPDDKRLVFAEGAIDALSHAALFPAPDARYASIGGNTNPKQPALILAAVKRMPACSEIVAAMDNDAAGETLAALIENAVRESVRPDLAYRRHLPANTGQDWNDVLRAGRPAPLPSIQP